MHPLFVCQRGLERVRETCVGGGKQLGACLARAVVNASVRWILCALFFYKVSTEQSVLLCVEGIIWLGVNNNLRREMKHTCHAAVAGHTCYAAVAGRPLFALAPLAAPFADSRSSAAMRTVAKCSATARASSTTRICSRIRVTSRQMCVPCVDRQGVAAHVACER